MGVVIILLIIAILIGVAVLSLRVFSIERVETIVPDEENPDDPDAEGADGESDGEDEGDGEPEMVNVFDYFNEDEAEVEAAEDETDSDAAERKAASGDGTNLHTDKLTDFKNGRRYLVDCRKSLDAAKEDGRIFCAVYFDFDRFSYINSLKGAATGDYVLTNTGQQLRRIFPEGALISRISCDHFTALFPLVDLSCFDDYYEQLRRMCEKIRNDIAAKTGMRICVGFATTDNDASYDVNVLLTRANIARHSSKVTKTEKFESYDESMIASNFFGDTMMDDYTECQYGDEFTLYFETQSDLVADKVIGCDTLVRWTYDDNNGVPITPDTGHIPTNNDKVIYHVCRSVSRWRKAGREAVLVFIDLPVTELFKVDVDEFIAKCVTEFQIEPQTIVAKVDVSIPRLDWVSSSKQFKKLHDIGIKLCISGVDTSYSNLEFLSGLPIDFIKLHKSFAYGVEKNREQLEKCRRISERALSIGARVIFEGVDTTEQVAALRTINAKIVQGRYTGRPRNTDELTRELPEHVELRTTNDGTVILDDAQLSKGEWTLF